MLTQNHPSVSTAIRIDNAPLGFGIYLGDEYLGLVETYPVWGLDANYDSALAQGLTPSDECFVANNFPYRYLQSAIGGSGRGVSNTAIYRRAPRLHLDHCQPFPRLGGYTQPTHIKII